MHRISQESNILIRGWRSASTPAPTILVNDEMPMPMNSRGARSRLLLAQVFVPEMSIALPQRRAVVAAVVLPAERALVRNLSGWMKFSSAKPPDHLQFRREPPGSLDACTPGPERATVPIPPAVLV